MDKDGAVVDKDFMAMVYHIDARTSANEAQLQDINEGISRLEGHLMNKGNINWVGIIIALAGSIFGLSQYVELQQRPYIERLEVLRAEVKKLDEFRYAMHFEIGGIGKQLEDIERLWEHIHKQEDMDREHDQAVAEAKVSRKAIGDYLREHANDTIHHHSHHEGGEQ